MQWTHIYALFLRHWYPLKRDFDLLTDMLYWPIFDTITWGLASSWMVTKSEGSPNIILSILIALILWNIMWRSQMEISRNLIDEIWNQNLVNLFSTPLRLREWIVSVLGQSIFKMMITATAVSATITVMYAADIFALGWWILPMFVNTILTGWCIGFITAGIVIRYGAKMQTVVWTLPAMFFPLSAVYFPVSQLPQFWQYVSYCVPTTYVFEGMRQLLFTGTIDTGPLWLSFAMNGVYLVLTIMFFVRRFKKSKELNFGRFTA